MRSLVNGDEVGRSGHRRPCPTSCCDQSSSDEEGGHGLGGAGSGALGVLKKLSNKKDLLKKKVDQIEAFEAELEELNNKMMDIGEQMQDPELSPEGLRRLNLIVDVHGRRAAAMLRKIMTQTEYKRRLQAEVDADEKWLLATQPLETLLRRDGLFKDGASERRPSDVLQPKPLYDPALSEAQHSIDRDSLVVWAWHFLVLGKVKEPKPLQAGFHKAAAEKTATNAPGGAARKERRRKPDVRTVGLVAAAAGLGKTHCGMDVWYFRDQLDQPRFTSAAREEGIPEEVWANVARKAKAMRVCCLNFNGLTAWDDDDTDLVKLSPWYEQVYSDNKEPQGFSDKNPPTFGEDAGSRVVCEDAHLLPLYLRVLWLLKHQTTMSYSALAAFVKTGLELKKFTAASVIREARDVLKRRRHAFIVDELTMARMFVGDRILSELYRHVICTFTNGRRGRVVFLSLSFLFVSDEVNTPDPLVAPGGLPPKKGRLTTTGTSGDGSPWSLAVIATLLPPSTQQLTANLLPLAKCRTVHHPRSVGNDCTVDPSEVSRGLASLSGGHMRTFAYMRDLFAECRPGSSLWSVVMSACSLTGLTGSVGRLVSHLAFFPALLVAGLLRCDVKGDRALMPSGDSTPPDVFCTTWDAAVAVNLLSGSTDADGWVQDPCVVTALLLALASEWKIKDIKGRSGVVNPEVEGILCALSRLVAAAEMEDPDRAWEVTSYWVEVLQSRLCHASLLYLEGDPGVRDVPAYSRLALQDLYQGVTNLEKEPAHHPLLADVLVDASVPMTAADVEHRLIPRMRSVADVLKIPVEDRLNQVFMMANAHPSFDLIRFFRVVQDPRPDVASSHKTDGVVAVVISSKSTANPRTSLPLTKEVTKPAKLLPVAFGDQWETWKHSVVHVTLSNYRRTDRPTKFLPPEAEPGRIIVVCRDNFELMYGRSLAGVLSLSPWLHGGYVVK